MILEIKNTGVFKKKIASLKMIINECSFVFKKEGLYINEIDISGQILVYFFFGNKYFKNYQYSEDESYNLNLLNFYKCLKTITLQNELFLKFVENNLEIIGQKKDKKQIYYIPIKYIQKDIPNQEHKSLDYNNIFELNKDFYNSLLFPTDLQLKELSIEIKNNKIILISKNDDLEIIKEFSNSQSTKSTNYDIKSNYNIYNIYRIFSFLRLFEKMTISINNNSPIKVEMNSEECKLILISSNISVTNN